MAAVSDPNGCPGTLPQNSVAINDDALHFWKTGAKASGQDADGSTSTPGAGIVVDVFRVTLGLITQAPSSYAGSLAPDANSESPPVRLR